MKTAIAIGVLLFAATVLSASAQEITIKSIAYTSLPYYSTTVYPVNSASSDTSCNSTGNGNVNATVYPAPGGATVSGTTTTNTDTNCTTTYHPAQNGQFTRRIIYNYNLVEGNGYRYELLCTANWIGSKCAYLIPGQSFQATIKGSDMLIAGTNAKGKTKEVKYHILAMAPYPSTAGVQPGQSNTSVSGGNVNSLTGCLSGSAASANYTLTTTSGSEYTLTGNFDQLRRHIGQEIQVTGPSSGASIGQPFQVTSVTQVGDHCNRRR